VVDGGWGVKGGGWRVKENDGGLRVEECLPSRRGLGVLEKLFEVHECDRAQER